jgi:hypothetical protein
VNTLETLYEQSLVLGCDITWGTGAARGSFNVKELSACQRSLLTVYSDGLLTLNFGWLNGSEIAERARERWKDLIAQQVGLRIPEDYTIKSPAYPFTEWAGKVVLLIASLKQLVSEFRAATSDGPT